VKKTGVWTPVECRVVAVKALTRFTNNKVLCCIESKGLANNKALTAQRADLGIFTPALVCLFLLLSPLNSGVFTCCQWKSCLHLIFTTNWLRRIGLHGSIWCLNKAALNRPSVADIMSRPKGVIPGVKVNVREQDFLQKLSNWDYSSIYRKCLVGRNQLHWRLKPLLN